MYALSSSNINRFSKFFHCQNQEKICNNTITKDPTIPQVCRYTTLWNVRLLKATISSPTVTSAVFTSNVQCVHLAAGRRTQAGNATDQWRDQWNAFHKVVYRHTWGMVGSLVIVLLQIFSWFWQWKNFENRLIFDEVKAYKNGAIFIGPPCICDHGTWTYVTDERTHSWTT